MSVVDLDRDEQHDSHQTTPGRDETEEQREDRNLAELLQELRVAGLGIQVLFGFLLSLPFTTRFTKLDSTQRDLYLVGLIVAALSIALLAAPVAHHRVLFRRHRKAKILRVANIMAVLGLCAVGFAVSTAVLLVTSFVAFGVTVPIIASATFLSFYGLWFGFPITSRIRADYATRRRRTVDARNKEDGNEARHVP